jgi:hypothetical protein
MSGAPSPSAIAEVIAGAMHIHDGKPVVVMGSSDVTDTDLWINRDILKAMLREFPQKTLRLEDLTLAMLALDNNHERKLSGAQLLAFKR